MNPPPCLAGYLCVDESMIDNEFGYNCIPEGGYKKNGKPKRWTVLDIKEPDSLKRMWNVLKDIDECTNPELAGAKSGVPLCNPNQQCKNTIGNYRCDCMEGYTEITGNNGDECVDVDECASGTLNTCDENARCVNNEGSFDCVCNAGYSFGEQDQKGDICKNINECDANGELCDGETAECVDTGSGLVILPT